MAQNVILLSYRVDSPFPVLNPLQANDWVLWAAQTSAATVSCLAVFLLDWPRLCSTVGCFLAENGWQISQVPTVSVFMPCRGLRPRPVQSFLP